MNKKLIGYLGSSGIVMAIIALITSVPSLVIANNFDIKSCNVNTYPDPNAWLNIYSFVSIGVFPIVFALLTCCIYGNLWDPTVPIIAILFVIYYIFYIIYCSIGAKLVLGDLIDCIGDSNAVAIMILVDVSVYFLVLLVTLLLLFSGFAKSLFD